MAAILRGACSSRAITASLLVRSLSTSPVARSKVAVVSWSVQRRSIVSVGKDQDLLSIIL